MPYQAPGGAIGGIMAAQAFKQDQEVRRLQAEEAALGIQEKKLAMLAGEELRGAIKAAAPELAKKDGPEAVMGMADIAMATGQPELAGELMSRAATMSTNRATTAEKEHELSIEQANSAAALLDGVTDGPSLEAAYQRTTMQGIDTKGVIPGFYEMYKRTGWTPELQRLVGTAQRSIMSKKEQLEIERIKAQTTRERQLTRESEVRTNLVLPAQAEASRALAAKRKSGGTTTAGAKADQAMAETLIKSRYEIDTTSEYGKADLKLMANRVAGRAEDIRKSSPALTRAQALEQAYEQMTRGGDFAGLPEREGTYYNPIPVPIVDGKIDQEALETGITYDVPVKGGGTKRVVWNGKMFGSAKPLRLDDADFETIEETPAPEEEEE